MCEPVILIRSGEKNVIDLFTNPIWVKFAGRYLFCKCLISASFVNAPSQSDDIFSRVDYVTPH